MLEAHARRNQPPLLILPSLGNEGDGRPELRRLNVEVLDRVKQISDNSIDDRFGAPVAALFGALNSLQQRVDLALRHNVLLQSSRNFHFGRSDQHLIYHKEKRTK